MPPTLAELRIWDCPTESGLNAYSGTDFKIILGADFVTLDTDQTATLPADGPQPITGDKQFTGIVQLDGSTLITDTVALNTVIGNGALAVATGGENTALGANALAAVSVGTKNTGIGVNALAAAAPGINNVAIGRDALTVNIASQIVAIGADALKNNITGLRLVAVGYQAGEAQAGTTDDDNTFIGFKAGLVSNGSATGENTAVGANALVSLTTGDDCTAIGSGALASITTAQNAVAVGTDALENNLADFNVALGIAAGLENVTGQRNTFIGYTAGRAQAGTTDDDNTWVGFESGLVANGAAAGRNVAVGSYALTALTTGNNNVALGVNALAALTTGATNTAVGRNAGATLTTGSGNILVGHDADVSAAGAAGQITIGDGIACDQDNQLTFGNAAGTMKNEFDTDNAWTQASDVRKKTDIENSPLGLDFINLLEVVTYRWRNPEEWPEEWGVRPSSLDTDTQMLGLIAQDVKRALDESGCPHRFAGWGEDANGMQRISKEMFVFPLINAVKELAAKIERLESANDYA